MYSSLREFITELEREGELIRIRPRVSSDCEIAEITERIAKTAGGGKALLFEKTDSEFPVLTNMYGSERRMAMALGVKSLDDIAARIDELLYKAMTPKDNFADKLKMLPLLAEMSHWLPKKTKRRGECQQVVLTGDKVDLGELPILRSRVCDGGRFITLPMVHTVDPDTGIRNVGMYRMQVFDGRTTGMHWHIHKTGARHYDAYKRAGRRMPVSVAIGGDPVYTYCATAPMPDNMDEYMLAGFLRHKPVRLVKCLTNDIYVPADCDFVIEGYVDPSEAKVVEGPFGDHTGFYSLTDLYPLFHITAITHRRDAVYPATVVGIPPQEDAYISMATEKIFLAPIRLALQPEIEDMTMPVAGTSHNIAVVSLDSRYAGQAAKTAMSLWGAGQMMFNKYMLLTAGGTDIREGEVLAALLRRIDTRRDIIRGKGVLDVLDHATATCGYGGKMAVDATVIDPASAVEPYGLPAEIAPSHGITKIETAYAETWGALLLFGSADADVDGFIAENGLDRVNFILLFDERAESLSAEELLWIAAANTDPRRDVVQRGRALLADARTKRAAHGRAGANKAEAFAKAGAEAAASETLADEGAVDGGRYPSRFPNVVTSSPETIAAVDARWADYGCGEFIPSPSKRYMPLLQSDKAEIE